MLSMCRFVWHGYCSKKVTNRNTKKTVIQIKDVKEERDGYRKKENGNEDCTP